MQGKIEDFSIPDIFQLISSQGKSGSLNISSEGRSTDFFFNEGRIVDVQPVQPLRDYQSLLGTMLRDAGYITDSELRRALEVMGKGEGKKIGDVLVEQGIVHRDVVSKYLVLQTKECLFDVLTYKLGRYKFQAFAVRPVSWGREPIRPDVLMMEGMQFLDEYPIYRQKFPPGDFRVTCKKGEHVNTQLFSEQEGAIWKALSFSNEPTRVFRKACMTVFEGIKGLSALHDRGLLDIELAPPPEVDVAKRVREKIRALKLMAALRAVVWAGAAALMFLWIRKLFMSPESLRFFAGWMEFFQ